MVRLALAQMILKFSMFVEVGEVLTLLSAFRRVFLASLHSSLNQTVLCLTTLGLLSGILWLAIFIRMFVKFATGSSGSRTDSYFNQTQPCQSQHRRGQCRSVAPPAEWLDTMRPPTNAQ